MKAKIKLLLIILVLNGCITNKRSKPCKDCPHFTHIENDKHDK